MVAAAAAWWSRQRQQLGSSSWARHDSARSPAIRGNVTISKGGRRQRKVLGWAQTGGQSRGSDRLRGRAASASLPRCLPPQERDALVEVSPSCYLNIVIPPFVYPSKLLCPQLLHVQYVVAVVNVDVPRLDKHRNSGLVEYVRR